RSCMVHPHSMCLCPSTSSLHDALPISTGVIGRQYPMEVLRPFLRALPGTALDATVEDVAVAMMTTDTVPKTAHRRVDGSEAVVRSEEHTSELQSRENLVCRLLLEKKNT